MKTMKILFTLVVFVMMGLTVSAQAKKDTTVIFKIGIHCPSCKAKLDKDMPFEKGIKDYKLNMKDSTVLISFRTDKNVAKKGIKKLAREAAVRNIIAVAPVDKAVARKSVTANVIRNASQRRANVKGNVVIIAAPRRVKQTSAVRIKRSKKFIPKVIQRERWLSSPFFLYY